MKSMDYQIALQCAYLAQDVYQDFSNVSFRGWPGAAPKLIERPASDTQLAILEDPDAKLAVIVFRGSDAGKDWGTNLNMSRQMYEWSRKEKKEYRQQLKQVSGALAEEGELIYPKAYGKASSPVKMHRGFMTAYLSVRDAIHDYVNNSEATQYRIVGHSLGGALAKLCAVDLQYNFASNTGILADSNIDVETYTFGAPRVGNKAFAASYTAWVPKTWRVVNGWDAVSGLPHIWQGYRHAETLVKLDRGFTWRIITARVADHFMTGYIKSLETKVIQLVSESVMQAQESAYTSRNRPDNEGLNPSLAGRS